MTTKTTNLTIPAPDLLVVAPSDDSLGAAQDDSLNDLQEVPLTGAPYLWQIVDAGDGNITATYNDQSFTGSPKEFTRRLA